MRMGRCLWAALLAAALSSVTANATMTWTVAVDQVSSVTNQMRSVAVAQQSGNNSVYVGLIQTSGNRDVRQYDANAPYALLNNRTPAAGGEQPKGIATDDRGNVFVGNRGSGTTSSRITSASASLVTNSSTSATTPVIGGLDVVRSGNNYYAYVSYEGSGLIQRFDVTNPAGMFLDATFGTLGSYNLPGAGVALRGLDVDAAGNIFVASRDTGLLYKVSADLTTVSTAGVPRAMDVSLFGGKAYVTSYNGANSLIRVLNMSDLSFVDDITNAEIGFSRGSAEGYGGIDIGADGRIWLTDQQYNVSGTTADRLLVSSPIPEPATLALVAAAGAILLRRRTI